MSTALALAEQEARAAEKAVNESLRRQATTRLNTSPPFSGPRSYRTLHEEDAGHARTTLGFPDEGEANTTARTGCDPSEVIIPDGTWKETWDIWILMLILYSATTVPFRVCFSVDASGLTWWFEVSMSFFFLADVALSFRTAFFLDGGWVKSPAAIARRYLTGWFWIDAPSSAPLELLDLLPGAETSQFALLRFLRLLRLLRLLKLLKLDEYIDQIEDALDVNLRFLQVVIMLIKVIFLGHILGCFWYGVGASQPDEPRWYTAYAGDDADPSISSLYLWSIYWAMMTLTTTGYGDIIPTNDAERAYVLFALMIGALVFGFMISNLSSVINSLDRQAALNEERLDSVKQYLNWRGLPKPLCRRVKKHYKYFYERQSAFDEVELLKGCPPALRAELSLAVLKETLGKVPLFADATHADPEFQSELFPVLKPVSFIAGEVIFKKGDPSRELLFLIEGVVDVHSLQEESIQRRLTPTHEVFVNRERILTARQRELADPKDPHEQYFKIAHTGCFGESVLTGDRRPATHEAHTLVETLVVSRNDLISVFKANPRTARKIFVSVMAEYRRKERLYSLAYRLILAMMPKGGAGEQRAVLLMQFAWKRYRAKLPNESPFGDFEVAQRAKLRPDGASPSPTRPDRPSKRLSGSGGTSPTEHTARLRARSADTGTVASSQVALLLADRDAARRERDDLQRALVELRTKYEALTTEM
jgi:CRP-like cAMP-binding protein